MANNAAESLFYDARDDYYGDSSIGTNVNEGLMIIIVAWKEKMTRSTVLQKLPIGRNPI